MILLMIAAKNAANAMNTLQSILTTAAKIQRPFTDEEMLEIADLYRDARLQLNALYEYLSEEGKEKYYGYFMQVTEYKVAELSKRFSVLCKYGTHREER